MYKIKKCKYCKKDFQQFNSLDFYCCNNCKIKCQKEKDKIKKAKIKEKKKVSPSKLYKANVEMAKNIAKQRDGYICQHCGATTNIHGSHIINEARDHRLSTNEYNIKALCYNCHLNWWHKNPIEASRWFEEKFPLRYEELNSLHLKYSKMGKIGIEWHLAENERLKKLLTLNK